MVDPRPSLASPSPDLYWDGAVVSARCARTGPVALRASAKRRWEDERPRPNPRRASQAVGWQQGPALLDRPESTTDQEREEVRAPSSRWAAAHLGPLHSCRGGRRAPAPAGVAPARMGPLNGPARPKNWSERWERGSGNNRRGGRSPLSTAEELYRVHHGADERRGLRAAGPGPSCRARGGGAGDRITSEGNERQLGGGPTGSSSTDMAAALSRPSTSTSTVREVKVEPAVPRHLETPGARVK